MRTCSSSCGPTGSAGCGSTGRFIRSRAAAAGQAWEALDRRGRGPARGEGECATAADPTARSGGRGGRVQHRRPLAPTARRHRGRTRHGRADGTADRSTRAICTAPGTGGLGAASRRRRRRGDRRATAVPPRCRPGPSVAEPARRQSGRRTVRAGRTEHRAAPARQPTAHRDTAAAAGPWQHRDRRRARREDREGRRLGGGHRAGRARTADT